MLEQLPHVTDLVARVPGPDDAPPIPPDPENVAQVLELLRGDEVPAVVRWIESVKDARISAAAEEAGGAPSWTNPIYDMHAGSLRHHLNVLLGNAPGSHEIHAALECDGTVRGGYWPESDRDYIAFTCWDDLPGVDGPLIELERLIVRGRWVGRSGLVPREDTGAAELADRGGAWAARWVDTPLIEFLRVRRMGYALVSQVRAGNRAQKDALRAVRASESDLGPLAASWYGSRVLEPLRAARAFLSEIP